MRLSLLINLDAKGVKKSLESWANIFCKVFTDFTVKKAFKFQLVQCYGVNWIPFRGEAVYSSKRVSYKGLKGVIKREAVYKGINNLRGEAEQR